MAGALLLGAAWPGYAPPMQVFFCQVFRDPIAGTLVACALVAVSLRRRRLAALSCAPALVVLVPVLVAWAPSRALPAAPDSRPALRLFSANLLYATADTERVLDQVRAQDPDMVLIQE